MSTQPVRLPKGPERLKLCAACRQSPRVEGYAYCALCRAAYRRAKAAKAKP